MKRKPWVYVAGPYSDGDVMLNIRKAIEIGNAIAARNLVPIIPHLSGFWHVITPKHYGEWLDYDLQLLSRCDALFRLVGTSPGADGEVKFAKQIGIPIFYTFNQLEMWFSLVTPEPPGEGTLINVDGVIREYRNGRWETKSET